MIFLNNTQRMTRLFILLLFATFSSIECVLGQGTSSIGPGVIGTSGTTNFSSLNTTLGTGVDVFDWTIVNPAASSTPTTITGFVVTPNTNDNVADWTKIIAGAQLSDGTNTIAGVINTQNITFSSIPIGVGQLGYTADNTTKTYTMKIWFLNPFDATVRATADNKIFEFRIRDNETTVSGGGSTSDDLSNSGDNSPDIKVDVVATKLLFVQQPSLTAPGANMSAVTVEATDANGNRDLNITSNIRITSSGTLTGSPVQVAAASGLATFSTLNHSVAGLGLTLTAADNPVVLTGATSNTFDIRNSNSSDIIVNAGFTYPTNVAYNTFQENSDIVNSATSLVVAKFDIRDGGGSNDPDALPTVLTNLSLDLGSNFGFIRRIALYDAAGTAEIATTEQAVSTQIVTWSGLSLSTVTDNSSLSFTVRVSFKATVTDNAYYGFTVSAATAQLANSIFAAAAAGGATTSVTGNNNKVAVTATRLAFLVQPSNTYVNGVMTPSPSVQAMDALSSVDTDINTTTAGVTSDGTLSGSPTTGTFTNGVATYGAITHTAAAASRTLTTTNSLTLANGSSSTFDILAPSASSDIIANAGFTYPTNINYVAFQEAADITNSGTSLVVAKFDIRDGGASVDADPLPTVLTQLTLDLGSNFGFIRRIALYDAAGTAEIAGTETGTITQTMVFSGLNLSAPDNGSLPFTVRVSFNTAVVDKAQFSFQVSATTSAQATNSTFAATNAGGAVSSTTGNNNKINAIASKLVFQVDASNAYVGDVMSPSPTVRALDPNDILDLDFVSAVDVTSGGTLSATPQTATFVAGVGTYSNIVHTAVHTTKKLTATFGGLTSGLSSNFDILALSNTSDIIADAAFTYPTNIDYSSANNQIGNITNATGIAIGQFIIRDGGGATDGDSKDTKLSGVTFSITNSAFIRRVALYDGATEIAEVAPAGGFATFVGLTGLDALDAGPTNKVFTVKVSFNAPVTDNQQFLFTITAASTPAANSSQFAAGNAGGALTSIAGNDNRVVVTASKLSFIVQPSNVLLLNTMTAVTVEAIDALNSRDLDITSTIGLTSTGTLLAAQNATFVAGLGTYSTIVHTATGAGLTMSTTSGTLTNATSAPVFSVTASNASNIVRNGVFIEPTNIAYDTYQESVDITNSGSSIVVGKFDIQDGGGAADPDGAGTTLSSLTLNLGANFNYIRRIALYDATGTIEIAGTEQGPVAAAAVVFPGLSLTAPDNGTLSFTVRASFKTAVVDNNQVSFTITAASTTALVSSTFPLANAGGAATSLVSPRNQMEVLATRLQFVQQPTTTLVTVGMSPSPTVEAVDALNNRDLDFVSLVGMNSTGSLVGAPVNATFVAGLGTYPGLVHNVDASGLFLSTNSGLVNVPSAAFEILSKSSDIIANVAFPYPANIPYDLSQENSNIVVSPTSVAAAKFDIRDGGALPDGDTQPTILTNLSLDLGTNYTAIRRIALYDATGTLELAGSEQAVSAQVVNFAGLTLNALDNGSVSFIVRVSFNAPVTDNQQFSFTVTSTASQAGNSGFALVNAGGATSSVAGNDNRISVTATKLRFVQQPTSTLNGNAMSPSVTVEATDALNSRDLDFASIVGLTSTGTLSASPQNAAFASGLGTYPGIIHTVNGAGLTLSSISGPLTNATSTTFNITSSNASDIIANVGFVYPANVPYDNFQENANIVNSGTSRVVAMFDIRDGGGVADPDNASTILSSLSLDLGANFGYIRRIALYDASGINEIAGTEQAVGSQIMTFPGLAIAASDNSSASFTVRVSFTTAVVDNQQYSFTITSASTQPNVSSTFPLGNAGGAVSSTAGNNNRIEVTATKLAFTTNLTSPLLPSINVSSQQAAPVIKAQDIFNNTDLDYLTNVTLTCALPVTPSTTLTAVAGVYTFPAAFQYTTTGTGTLTANSGVLAAAISNPVTVQAGSATAVLAGAAAPASIASTVNTVGAAVSTFFFDVTDDKPPVAPTNDDGLPTLFTQVIISQNGAFNSVALSDWTQAIGGAVLHDNLGNTFAGVVGASTITFSGIPTGAGQLGYVADNATKNYDLQIFLKASLGGTLPSTIDGKQFEFEVFNTSFTLAANSTGFVASSTNSGNKNAVAVTGTQLRFLTPSSATSASLSTNFPGGATFVSIEASDVNNNRDLDFNGAAASTVAIWSNASARTMINKPTPGTTTFTSGLLNLSNTFQYTTGSNGDDVTLTIKAGPGPGTTCGVNGILCGTSPLITLQSSFESMVKGDPSYLFNTNVGYVNYQTTDILPIDIVNGNGSYELARVLVSDGDADGTPGDLDGATTTLTSISLRIADATDVSTLGHIRRIALYNSGLPGAVEIADVAVSAGDLAAGFVTFSGLSIVAPDDNLPSATPLSIRVSFNSTPSTIIDKTLLRVSVVGATVGGGSGFRTGDIPADIGGISGGLKAPLGVNFVNVVATKLDFTTQPAAFAGKNESVIAGVVEARDKFDIRDLDFNSVATVTAPQATVNGAFSFTNGVLNMAGLITYGSEGNGTLTVTAGGINSNSCPLCTPIFTLYPSNHIDVIHISTVRNDGGPGGAPTGVTANLLAGGSNKVLFGFSFKSLYSISSPSNNPTVSSFTITFSQSTTGIFQNLRVYESTTGSYNTLLPEVIAPAIGGSYSPAAAALTVNFSIPRDLFLNPSLTYFLVADVNINVNGGTPAIKPSIVDSGTGSSTQGNIIASNGSQLSSTDGPTYTFASIAPPSLVSSYPAVAQTNVDKLQSTLELTFTVPVTTLDNRVQLWDKAANTFVTLTSSNPSPPSGAQPLIFDIPGGTLANNKEYYVIIAPGDLTTTVGIADLNLNLFPGISSSGTLFFRTSDPTTPPKMLGANTLTYAGSNATAGDPFVSDITNSGAVLNSTFNKEGKAFFMVCSTNNPTPPTVAQIQGAAYASNTVVARGSFDVNATTTISQFGLITPTSGSFTAGTHYVWVCAEAYSDKNRVLIPIPTLQPYGKATTGTPNSLAEIGGAVTGPTLTFIAPGPPPPLPLTNISTNGANITFCSNSDQILNTPIIIYEGTSPAQQFNNAAPQTLNLVLPAGFQFDISTNILTGFPNYGTLTLQGADFTAGSLSYLSSSVLRISFKNSTTASQDKIIITGLRIKSTGSASGNIFRLGGNFNPSFTDGTSVANLSAQDAAVIDFDNSYSLGLVPPSSLAGTGSVETAIPDDAIPSLVTLTPYTANTFDFGPSTFSGPGINTNTLNLQGVTIDVPFNITITHKDQNGCISNNPVQYVVYNHNRAVNITNALVNRPANIPVTLDQGPYCVTNPSFRIGQTNAMAAPTGIVRDITFDNLNAYRMFDLQAAIPASTPSAPINTAVGLVTLPIISVNNFGATAWKNIVTTLPVKDIANPHIFTGGPYFDFKFDDKKIINANAIDPAIPYIYDIFKRTTVANPNYGNVPQTYYQGGSLGKVEFTGFFRNNSNPVVIIKRRQLVEFFVPAVPLVELVTPYSFLDISDPNNLPAAPAGTNPNNPGTLIYCVGGGNITINGYPQADPARGKIGTFKVYNAAVGGAVINSIGFTDFTNGTAQIDPTVVVLQNGFNDIRIEYTYFDASNANGTGTCSTTGSQVIRISPNPVASYTRVSQPGSLLVDYGTPTAFCEKQAVAFDGSGSTVTGAGVSLTKFTWDFTDATNSISSNPNNVSGAPLAAAVTGVPAAGTNQNPVHTFIQPSAALPYQPTLVVSSNHNCPSVSFSLPVKVGGIPIVKKKSDGVYVGQSFNFSSNNSTVSGNDFFRRIDWDFGDSQTASTVYGVPPATDPLTNVPHTYTVAGAYAVDMKVTSVIGCINSLSLDNSAKGLSVADNARARTLIALDRVPVATGAAGHYQDFEGVLPGNWVPWFAPNNSFPLNFPAPAISWTLANTNPKYGLVLKPDPTSQVVNGNGFWRTGTGSVTPASLYTPNERSAIYSPSFDLSLLQTPMISYNSLVQTHVSDGVILEYSTDNLNVADPNKAWKVLGLAIGEGVGWFDAKGITAKPGKQNGNDFGWSGLTNTTWFTSKHTLDEIPNGPPAITPNNVVFRFAFASTYTPTAEEGFAVDNIRIGERTRTIMLESFANTANVTVSPFAANVGKKEEKVMSDSIAQFYPFGAIGTQVVKLNYHINFPANDPFNLDNPADPSSRALYYNITSTPKSRLDGAADPKDRSFGGWANTSYGVRSLALASAFITITPTVTPGKLTVKVDVTAIFPLPANTILHVAIVEKSVAYDDLSSTQKAMIKSGENISGQKFEYSPKAFLPNASGTKFGAVLPVGSTITKTFTWDVSKLYLPLNDLEVVAFVQQEDGAKEVYQANRYPAKPTDPKIPDPTTITALEPIPAEDIIVFPNPANREMNILLPGVLQQEANIQMYDQTGRVAMTSTIAEGAHNKVVNTQDLSSGLYILSIEIGPGNFTRKKVMVVHE